MNKALLDTSIFEPLLPYLMQAGTDGRVIFKLPPSLKVNDELVLAYFEKDVTISYQRNGDELKRCLIGTLKDMELAKWLLNKLSTANIKFSFAPLMTKAEVAEHGIRQ